MQSDLRSFLRQYLGVVCSAFAPVLLTTFLSTPYILGMHPGEPHGRAGAVERHLC